MRAHFDNGATTSFQTVIKSQGRLNAQENKYDFIFHVSFEVNLFAAERLHGLARKKKRKNIEICLTTSY